MVESVHIHKWGNPCFLRQIKFFNILFNVNEIVSDLSFTLVIDSIPIQKKIHLFYVLHQLVQIIF